MRNLFSVKPESKPDMPVDTGLERKDRHALAKELSVVLANTSVLNARTMGVHWNVTGPLFHSVHNLTEEQYVDLGAAMDRVAERMRALGYEAPSTLKDMAALSELKEKHLSRDTTEMIHSLIEGNEQCAKSLRSAIRSAEEVDDLASAGLLTERLERHEQNVWMLRSLVSETGVSEKESGKDRQ